MIGNQFGRPAAAPAETPRLSCVAKIGQTRFVCRISMISGASFR